MFLREGRKGSFWFNLKRYTAEEKKRIGWGVCLVSSVSRVYIDGRVFFFLFFWKVAGGKREEDANEGLLWIVQTRGLALYLIWCFFSWFFFRRGMMAYKYIVDRVTMLHLFFPFSEKQTNMRWCVCACLGCIASLLLHLSLCMENFFCFCFDADKTLEIWSDLLAASFSFFRK